MKTSKELSNLAVSIQNDAVQSIIDLMTENNVALISFVQNGDYSTFDVDRAYAFVLGNEYVEEKEIIAVYTDGKSLFLLPDINTPFSDLSLDLSEIIIAKNKDIEKIGGYDSDFEKLDWMTSDSLFNPTDTLIDLFASVEQTMELLPFGEIY